MAEFKVDGFGTFRTMDDPKTKNPQMFETFREDIHANNPVSASIEGETGLKQRMEQVIEMNYSQMVDTNHTEHVAYKAMQRANIVGGIGIGLGAGGLIAGGIALWELGREKKAKKKAQKTVIVEGTMAD